MMPRCYKSTVVVASGCPNYSAAGRVCGKGCWQRDAGAGESRYIPVESTVRGFPSWARSPRATYMQLRVVPFLLLGPVADSPRILEVSFSLSMPSMGGV